MRDIENEGAGAEPLAVPGLVWEDPNRHLHGWRPTHEWSPEPDPRETARRAHAEQLRDEALANVDPSLAEAARLAYAASTTAADAVRQLEAEKSALPTDISDMAVLASLTIDRRIDAARRVADLANTRLNAALAAWRGALVVYFNERIVLRERERAHELDEQAAQLQQQAVDIRLAPITARGWLENYLPPAHAAPPEPAEGAPAIEPRPPSPAQAAPKRRRGLFGGE